MRTTIDVEDSVLADLKKLQQREGKPLGRLVSELIAGALKERLAAKPHPQTFAWHSANLAAKVDLQDKDALWAALEAVSSVLPGQPCFLTCVLPPIPAYLANPCLLSRPRKM